MTPNSINPAPAKGPSFMRHLWPSIIVIPWFMIAYQLVSSGGLRALPGTVPFPLALMALVPPALFIMAYAAFPGVRRWVAETDIAVLIGLQTFRVLGIVFIFFWLTGELPAVFGLTAGMGDVAVGIVALWVTLAVARQEPGWKTKANTLFVFGMLDFVFAFGTGILSGLGMPLQFAGQPLPIMIQQIPLALIPAFGVPLFIIFHLMAWIKLHTQP
jgi:hypothetical protein